jgi:cytochrome c-type biogenesis protein CcmH/NrfG
MPEIGQLLILVAVVLSSAVVVGWPLFGRSRDSAGSSQVPVDDRGTLALRHRIAVESLRDVEADRRAGSLDPDGYLAARAEAEERAARTLGALEAAGAREDDPASRSAAGATGASGGVGSRRVAGVLGVVIAVLVVAGFLLPAPLSLANGTVVNAQLAAQQRAEAARQDSIHKLEASLSAKPEAAGLVELASLYLEGGTAADYQRAANLLLLAIRLDPKASDAYRLLITAYIQTGDYKDATAATDAYAKVTPTSPDIPFFKGLIAFQGTGDRAAAVRWFDEFLRTAPSDPRVAMVRSLRAEAAGQLPGGSSVPSAPPSAGP